MIAGDLVSYQSRRWIVVRVDGDYRTALLVNQDGGRAEVADSLDTDEPSTLQVVANPPADWPLVAFPTKRLTGPVVKITVPNAAARDQDLDTWADWVPADPIREGGTLYFNPELRLRPGEVLIATFKNGTKARITIPRNFGTVAERKTKANVPVYVAPEERTRFNSRDVFGDDD